MGSREVPERHAINDVVVVIGATPQGYRADRKMSVNYVSEVEVVVLQKSWLPDLYLEFDRKLREQWKFRGANCCYGRGRRRVHIFGDSLRRRHCRSALRIIEDGKYGR